MMPLLLTLRKMKKNRLTNVSLFIFYIESNFYIFNPISSNIIPDITPIAYNKIVIFIFSFMPLLVLNNTANPTPAPTSKPAIIVPTDIIFSKYICVMITEDAQFGINPIAPDIIGPSIGLSNIKDAIVSSPIICIAILITKVMINIKINIFTVCFKADLKIPCSQ